MFKRNLSFTLVVLTIFVACLIASRKAQAAGLYQSGMIPGHVDQYSMSVSDYSDGGIGLNVSIETKYEITSVSNQLWVNTDDPTRWSEYVSFGLNLSSTKASSRRYFSGGLSTPSMKMYQFTTIDHFNYDDGGGKGLVEAVGVNHNYSSGWLNLAPADYDYGSFSVYDYLAGDGGKGLAAVGDTYSSILFTLSGTFTGPNALEIGQYMLSMQQNVPEPAAWLMCSILPLAFLMKRPQQVVAFSRA